MQFTFSFLAVWGAILMALMIVLAASNTASNNVDKYALQCLAISIVVSIIGGIFLPSIIFQCQ